MSCNYHVWLASKGLRYSLLPEWCLRRHSQATQWFLESLRPDRTADAATKCRVIIVLPLLSRYV